MAEEHQLKTGLIILREYAPRKLAREYNNALYQGVRANTDPTGQSSFDIPIENLETAKDQLVLGMIQEAYDKDNKKIEVNQALIDNMDAEEFADLSEKCRKLAFGDDEDKKK